MDHPVHSMCTTLTAGLLASGNQNIGLPIKQIFTVTGGYNNHTQIFGIRLQLRGQLWNEIKIIRTIFLSKQRLCYEYCHWRLYRQSITSSTV